MFYYKVHGVSISISQILMVMIRNYIYAALIVLLRVWPFFPQSDHFEANLESNKYYDNPLESQTMSLA